MTPNEKFKDWLEKCLPKSADKYVSYFNTANKISIESNLGDLYEWAIDDWTKNEQTLKSIPDFVDKNKSGHNSLSASIAQYKKYLQIQSMPQVTAPDYKYPDYRWYWASSQPVLEFNRLDIIIGVTKIIGEIGGRVIYNSDFKNKLVGLERDLNLDPQQISKRPDDLSKNVIASAREYWQGPGILNTDNSLTILGQQVATELIDGDELAVEIIKTLRLPNENLPNRYTQDIISDWRSYNLEIRPLKLLIDILLNLFYNYDQGTNTYISVDELVNIIIPIAADTPYDLNKYCNAILEKRSGSLDISGWPKYSSGGNEDKRLPKEFLVALKYWGFLEQVEIKGADDTRYYLTNKARSLFKLNEAEGKKTPNDSPCSSPKHPAYEENKIFFGAPGTGKSTKITQLLKSRNVCDKYISRVTFHPDYDYVSFVGGYRPISKGKDIFYEFVPQVFINTFVQACNEPESQFYLIIEEINRGNCAEIFGDLFQLLDRNLDYSIKVSEELAYYLNSDDIGGKKRILSDCIFWNGVDCKMTLPSNLTLWATMNTSDQSLFPMDSAFKRRWKWEYIPINYDKNVSNNESAKFKIKIDNNTMVDWIDFIAFINNKITNNPNLGLDKCIGNYFVKPDLGDFISIEQFINKVMFYLWNDVFKDEPHDSIFENGITYQSFFPVEVNGKKELLSIFIKEGLIL
jgi:hypothetical protein